MARAIPFLAAQHVDELLEAIVHEIVHVLFFSSNLFDIGYGNQFQAADGRQVEVVREVDSPSTSQSRHVVVLPDVVAVAAAHFGCPSLDGVELSNDGAPHLPLRLVKR